MRALSSRQAVRCETAKNKTCHCRCGGQFHGAKRMIEPEDLAAYEQLPEDDPHHVRSTEERKKRAKIVRQRAQAPDQFRLWEES